MGKHRLVSVICAGLAVGCVVVSWAVWWYQIQTKGLLGETKLQFSFTKYKTINGDYSSTSDYGDEGEIKKIFATCLTFLTVGGAVELGFIAVTILGGLFFRKSTLLKILAVIAAIGATVVLSVSFFTFLGFTKAFKEDMSLVCGASSLLNDDNTPCEKFLGSEDDDSWGPGPGWWVLIGAILMSIFAAFGSIKTLRD